MDEFSAFSDSTKIFGTQSATIGSREEDDLMCPLVSSIMLLNIFPPIPSFLALSLRV
jgi:hypothetical protein